VSRTVKGIVTVAVWFLFIKGCLATTTGCVALAFNMFKPLECVAISFVGIAALTTCALAAWLRKKLD
jgi:hypothetical protein